MTHEHQSHPQGATSHHTKGDGTHVDCDSALDKLFDFLDGELDDAFESRLQAHVERCSHCFEVAAFERKFLEALKAARGEEKCPKALRDRVLIMLRTEGLEA